MTCFWRISDFLWLFWIFFVLKNLFLQLFRKVYFWVNISDSVTNVVLPIPTWILQSNHHQEHFNFFCFVTDCTSHTCIILQSHIHSSSLQKYYYIYTAIITIIIQKITHKQKISPKSPLKMSKCEVHFWCMLNIYLH